MAVDMTAPAPTTVVGAQKLRLSSGRSVWVLEAADAVSVRVLGTESRLHSEKGESIAATVVLKRHPRPEETRIGHLVNALTLTLDLELAPDAATLQAVTTELGGPAQAAKLRSGTITLVADHENVILSAHPGATGRTMLGGTIGGDDAYKVVEALLGSADVQLKFEVQVVAAPSTRRLHIAGLWVDVWDRLGDNGAVVDQAVFGTAVQQLLNAGCITVTTDPPAPSDEVAFAVAEMLWDYRIMIGNPSEPGTLELRPRPDPNDRFSITESKVVGRLVTLTGDVELRALVESCGCAIDEFVTLMVADEMSGGLVPVAPRHRARERRATTVRPIAVAGAGVLTAGTLVAAPIHRPVAVLAPGLRPSLDFTVAPAAPPPGPVVANLSDKDWPDHKDPKLRWYAPVPALIDGATDGPTFFELHHEGLTSEGQPALRAVISVPFELHDPSPDRAGNRRPVAAEALTVDLELPFRDAAAGNELRSHRVRGEIHQATGHRIAQFQVLNAWARIAYRALSDDTAEPARLVVSYRFSGYERTRVADPPIKTFGATLLRPGVASGLMLDAKSLTVSHPVGHFQIDPRRAKMGRPPKMLAGQFQKATTTKSRLTRKSFSRVEQIDVQRNCADQPNIYVEQRAEATAVIGCRPAFQLGTVAYRQFREVTSLRTGRYRVHQSQTDAGRYLVVPTTYRIGRSSDDGTERAYRPLAVLHAAVGVEPDDVEVLLEIGLQPDLRPIDRLDLEAAVRALDPRAQLIWPTEVPDTASTITWTAADTLAQQLTSAALPDGTIHFSAGLDVPGWMVLRGVLATSGLAGSAQFEFPDGSSVASMLEIDLRRVVGPWETGPITVIAADGQVTLGNPTVTAMSVALVAAYLPDGTVDSVPVDQVIAPGGTINIPWSAPSGAQLVTDHDIVVGDPVTIEEIRSFMEEVDVTIVVLNQIEPAEEVIIAARVSGHDPLRRVTLRPEDSAVEITFPLPLSAALSNPTLTYRVERQGVPGPWRTHELSVSAFVIITKEDFS